MAPGFEFKSSKLCATWWLLGMLEGMSNIEAQAYKLLSDLGASPVKSVLTAGGGAVNDKWTAMRAAALGVRVKAAAQGKTSVQQSMTTQDKYTGHYVQDCQQLQLLENCQSMAQKGGGSA